MQRYLYGSRIQHAWATAVEIVGLFTGQAIKSNEGKQEWKDFFKLISSAFAKMEKRPEVSDTPADPDELYTEIKQRADNLKIFSKMSAWSSVIKTIEPHTKELHYFLLELDVTEGQEQLNVRGYHSEEEPLATDHYLQAEKAQGGNPNKDVVLVGAKSVEELKMAYLNYFVNTQDFLNYLKQYLDKKVI